MATLSFEELKKQANEIKNETKERANSATRIGTHFLNIIEKIEEIQKEIDEINKTKISY